MNYLMSLNNLRLPLFIILLGLQNGLILSTTTNQNSIDLLAPVEATGNALMAQLKLEVANCKIRFENLLTNDPNLDGVYVEKEHLPTLYNLIDAVVGKAKIANFDLVAIIFKGYQARNCYVKADSGATRKLVIGCELLENFTYFELLAVLGHEVGHVKLNHIDRQNSVIMGVSLVAGMIIGTLIQGVELYNVYIEGSRWNAIKGHCKYTLPGLVTLGITADCVIKYLCRCKEYEADRFSYEIIHQPDALISGLYKLDELEFAKNPVVKSENWFIKSIKNLGNKHPSNEKRAAYLTQLAKQANKVKL